MVRFRSLVFAVIALVTILTAGIPAEAGKIRGTAIRVTFGDAPSDMITSDAQSQPTGGVDGQASYVNDVEGVTAVYDTTGVTLTMGRTRPVDYTRSVDFLFTEHATVGFDGSLCDSWTPFVELWMPQASIFATPIGTTLDDMAVGATVPATVAFDLDAGHDVWMLRFDNAMYPASSNAMVTRVDADTWTFSVGPGDVAQLLEPPDRKNPSGVSHGYYFMPFSFTVDRL